MLRAACRMRCSFSTSAMRTKLSPCSPKPWATATTPLLGYTLAGPVYLRANPAHNLPDLVVGFQGRAQLEDIYGKIAEVMLSQPATKIFMKTTEGKAAEWISDTLGKVEIERLKDVLYVGRPSYGQAESTVGMFKLTPDGTAATRVNDSSRTRSRCRPPGRSPSCWRWFRPTSPSG